MVDDRTLERKSTRSVSHAPPSESTASLASMLVRLGPYDHPESLIPQALAVASSLGRGLCLIEPPPTAQAGGAPVDPVDWELRRCAAASRLEALARRFEGKGCALEYRVLDRLPANGLAVHETLLCVSRREVGFGLPWHVDDLARHFLRAGGGAILVVPDIVPARLPVRFERVMIPLDGSSHAECALPGALAIAHHHGAELLLVYASPELAVIEQGAPDREALALAETLKVRNAQMAGAYLAEVRARCTHVPVVLLTTLLAAGDVRRRLVQATRDEAVDLLVLAAHGAGGHRDVLSGSVASFLLENVGVPVLMFNRATPLINEALYGEIDPTGLRFPDIPASRA